MVIEDPCKILAQFNVEKNGKRLQRRVTGFKSPAYNVGIIPTFKMNIIIEGLISKTE